MREVPEAKAMIAERRIEPPWDDLDDNIREVVRWLWRSGFEPTDSGDGRRAGRKAEMDGCLDVPHVFMRTLPEFMVADARRLVAICPAFDGLQVQATFSPLDGVATLELYGMVNWQVPS